MDPTTKDLTSPDTMGDYDRVIGTLHAFTGVVLLSLSKFCDSVKGRIITNFIARGMVCLESISALWKLGNAEDCWVLHRALSDRLFHLRHLSDSGQFELFEKWSFIKEYEAKHRTHCDSLARQKLPPEELTFTPAERERYERLKAEKIIFKMPRPKGIAKRMELPFLYSYGYDFGSRHVHPMASDGIHATQRILDKSKKPSMRELVVVQNSVLLQLLILHTGMRASDLLWMKVVHDFLDEVRFALETGSLKYGLTFLKIVRLWPANDVCCPKDT